MMKELRVQGSAERVVALRETSASSVASNSAGMRIGTMGLPVLIAILRV